jgi:integrase
MARKANRLTARTVATITKPGRHADGDGLYLIVDKSGAKRWAFIFRHKNPTGGKNTLREMGLGGLSRVSLADARIKAAECRRDLATGQNPIEVRREGEAARTAAGVTFGFFADELIESLKPGFRNAKHAAQWEMTLRVYAAPLQPMRLDEITTDDVLAVLKPLWQSKPETASRLRGRIERVLDAAKARGLRSGENPARWRGHLQNILPKPQKLTRGHHPAMPYEDVPAFIERLRSANALSARTLEFLILTGLRTSEVLGAQWSEIDFGKAVWSVPGVRMKQKKDHRVPLSDRAMEIVRELHEARISDYVFPGQKPQRPLSTGAMDALLDRMKIENATVHGFRSSFRDWCGEETRFPREIIEAALAHVVGDATERAYRRGDALEKRRELMAAWDNYCTASSGGNVVSMVIGI